jgi:hypothetical protein
MMSSPIARRKVEVRTNTIDKYALFKPATMALD